MRRIAIIGAGQAGLLCAHGLRLAGYDVTLYSDRSAEAWLTEARPTGTAARFELALAYERELGLNHWEDKAPAGEGVHLTFCPALGNRLLTLTGRLTRPFRAIDLRLQSHRWTLDLEARGGRVVVEPVTVERLDAIAAENDLTIVAVGRADLTRIFPRDAARSRYDRPQRNLAMVIVRGAAMRFEGIPIRPVKFNFLAPAGEAFWVPYYHKDHGPTWNLVFEARPGGPMDRFGGAKSGEEAVAIAREVIRDFMPWDYAWAKDIELADPRGWLTGSVSPAVRAPVGRLPSGRVVGCVGDTSMSLDPVGGQGANCGNKMARSLVEGIVARGDRPLDEAFLTETFERFWRTHGEPAYAFNHMLLEPITPAGRELLIAQYGSDGRRDGRRQRIADDFIENFGDPRRFTRAFLDLGAARELIERETRAPWPAAAAAGRVGIALGQIRQWLGLSPGHPAERR